MKNIRSIKDPLIQYFIKLHSSKDFRHEEKRILLSGEKRIKDLLAKEPYGHLLVSTTEGIPLSYDSEHVIVVTEEILRKITNLDSPPKMVADFSMPQEHSLEGFKWILALDRLQDPGNLGTLFRTARGLGWDGIYLIEPSCDPFNDKALRASEGAILSLPFRRGTLDQFLSFQKAQALPAFAASMRGALPSKQEKGLLILGNEGQGLSPVIESACTPISIPMKGGQESLNVSAAGAILMALLKGLM
jgi:RNA methyltransferase, TrmH family